MRASHLWVFARPLARKTSCIIDIMSYTVLTTPLDGLLRGLTRVIEVGPRGPAAIVTGLGERPRRIAQEVLQAVQHWVQARAKAHTVAVITLPRVTLTCDHLGDA